MCSGGKQGDGRGVEEEDEVEQQDETEESEEEERSTDY